MPASPKLELQHKANTSGALPRRQFLGAVGWMAAAGCRCQDGPAQATGSGATPPYGRRIDVHLHVSPNAVARAIALMDVEQIAMGVNLSGGPPGGSLEAQLTAAATTKGRLVVYTSPPWVEALRPGYGKRLAQALRYAAKLGARGLKISKGLGLGVVGPDGHLLRVDEPELDLLFETAGALNLPVMIHTGDPLMFWERPDPSNERYAELSAHPGWSLFEKQVPRFDELYGQLQTRIARHPQTRFVAVHFGNCAEQPERVAASLRSNPNLYIDTAARIPELGRHPPARIRQFFEEFQDRILFGSDLGVGPHPSPLFLGSSGQTPPTESEQRLFFDATRAYFESDTADLIHPTPIQGDWRVHAINLPTPILEKLYVTNAHRILGLQA